MNIDPDVVTMVLKVLAVNVVATLVLAALSYLWSVCALSAVAALDRWLDPSRQAADRARDTKS